MTDADGPPEAGNAPLVVAVDARSRTESRLVRSWARTHHPRATVVDHLDAELPRQLAASGPTRVVVPVRVTWLPRLRDGDRRVRLTDFALMVNPRRPPAALHKLLADRESRRIQLSDGAPGLVGDLRQRFADEAGRHDDAAFARFVVQQASVACDRAERAVIGDRYKVPRQVVEQISTSARFRERITALAEELERPVEEVQADGESCLGELATVQSPLGIDLYRAFMKPMHARAWTVEADPKGFEQLRELNRRHALVFLPTHRSYVDPLVLQQALDAHDLPPNHVLGGANMSWWPLGPIGRRAGVVFIRRSFGKDRVYKLAIREFLGYLVSKRFNLEWYIEGGRTRTGKLRPPKLGLLRYLAEALEDDRADDVMLVPVSIVYDRLREVGSMTAEQTGGKKQREDLRWWAAYVRSQSQNVGKARVHLGEPFAFRAAMAEVGSGPAQLEKVAFRICDAINAVTPVTSTSLVTLALLGSRGVALTFDRIEALTAPLLDYVERRDLPGPVAELRRPAGLRRGLESLVDAGVLSRYDGGTETVWSIAAGGHHVAAFYRNGTLHHVVNRAICELALLRVSRLPGATGADDHGWREALAIRDLLKFEFFFADKPTFRDQIEAELRVLDPDWRAAVSAGRARELLTGAPMVLANRALRSFADAQFVVAERLAARNPRSAVDRDAFIRECNDVGRQMLLQRRILTPEAVGRELFLAALDLAANRDLVDPGRDEVTARRRAWLDEVETLRRDLTELHDLDRSRQDGATDDDHR